MSSRLAVAFLPNDDLAAYSSVLPRLAVSVGLTYHPAEGATPAVLGLVARVLGAPLLAAGREVRRALWDGAARARLVLTRPLGAPPLAQACVGAGGLGLGLDKVGTARPQQQQQRQERSRHYAGQMK
eukprot:1680622-Prymnesium_polylepis.1